MTAPVITVGETAQLAEVADCSPLIASSGRR